MSKILLAGAAALAIALANIAPTLAQTAPARPPDGTYTYAIANVPGLTTTIIVIRSSGSTFNVFENDTINGSNFATEIDYDTQTAFPTRFHFDGGGQTAEILFSNGTATVAGTTLTRSRLSGTAGPTVSDQFIAPLVIFPTTVAANVGRALTDVAANGFNVVQMTPSTPHDVRPSGVPLADVESALNYGQYQTFWSNPTNHVVDRTDIGSASITLMSYSTATTTPAPPPPSPTPLPTAPPHFSSTDVTFASSGGAVIAGTLTVPNGAHPHRLPAFIFIHGSGAGTRDGALPENPTFLFLSNALSNNGVVVLRYDKRGIGKSTGTVTEDWHPLGDDARAAIAFLRRQPSVNPHRIFILGHSEGGEIAPLIAPTIGGLGGIVLMAGPAIPLDQIIAKQLPGPTNAKPRAMLDNLFAGYAGLDPAVYITKVNVPILVLQGGRDRQVLASDLPHLVNAARAAHRNITVKVLPDDDHLFLRLPPGKISDGAEYFVPQPLDPRVAQDILAWMRSLPTSSR